MRRAAQVAILALVGIALTAPRPAAAQTGGPSVTVLQPYVGQLIRIQSTGIRTTGRLIALGRDSVRLSDGDREYGIPLATIEALWVRKRATVTGLLVGAGVGLVAGPVIAAALVEAGEGGSISADDRNHMVAGGAIGAAVGAGLGALVGSLTRKWASRYP